MYRCTLWICNYPGQFLKYSRMNLIRMCWYKQSKLWLPFSSLPIPLPVSLTIAYHPGRKELWVMDPLSAPNVFLHFVRTSLWIKCKNHIVGCSKNPRALSSHLFLPKAPSPSLGHHCLLSSGSTYRSLLGVRWPASKGSVQYSLSPAYPTG